MDAKRLIVTLVFATILIGFFVWIVGVALQDTGRKNRIWREQAEKVSAAVEYMNGERIDMMYYGEELKAPESLRVRRIYNFEKDSLMGPEDNPEHDGHMIIINDPLGNLPLGESDWLELYKLMKNEGYVIVYLGSAQLPAMQEVGFFFEVYPQGTGSVVLWNSGRNNEVGFADDPSVIPEVVRETLSAEQIPVYAMIMKMQAKAYI